MVGDVMEKDDSQLWLSHSKMSAYVECPYYFKMAYIDKVPLEIKGNYHTALGNGIHKVLEDFYKNKDYSIKYLDNLWEMVCKKGYTEKNGEFVSPILKDDQYDFPKGEEEKNMLYYHGKKLLKEYFHKNKHSFGLNKLVATELNFKIEVGKGKVILNGYIDRVDRTPEGKLIVVDYKTGKEKTREEVDVDFQLTMYSFAIRKTFGEIEDSLSLHYIKSGNIIQSRRSKIHFDELLERVKYVKKGIEEKRFDPTEGDQCRYCLYDCPLGINKESRIAYLNTLANKK
jgi:ATP-dependent helicase/DNAse subunit B